MSWDRALGRDAAFWPRQMECRCIGIIIDVVVPLPPFNSHGMSPETRHSSIPQPLSLNAQQAGRATWPGHFWLEIGVDERPVDPHLDAGERLDESMFFADLVGEATRAEVEFLAKNGRPSLNLDMIEAI